MTDAAAVSAGTAAAAGAALATTGVALLPLAGWLGSRVVPERRVFFARWGGRHLLLVAAATLIGMQLAASLLGTFADDGPGALTMIATTTLGFLPAAAAVVWSARRTEPRPLESLGLQSGGAVPAVLYALGVYLLFLPALIGSALLWPWLYEVLGETWAPQTVLLAFAELEGGALAVAVVSAVVVVPFLEELLFRGFLQPFLVQNFRDAGGVALTAFLFALLHGGSAFGPVFVLALVLGGVALKTRRLWAPWAVHAAHNGLQLALFFAYPEFAEHPVGGWLGSFGVTP